MNTYVYHPEQRDVWGDHFFPTGVVLPWDRVPGDFGPDFVSRPDITPQLNRWYCVEFMVRANTPGLRDGRIAAWLDGALIADFPNLRLRDIDTLKIDRFGVSSHIKSNTNNETYMYYDNVVAATSYIGPRSSGSPVEPVAACNAIRVGKKVTAVLHDISGRTVSRQPVEWKREKSLKPPNPTLPNRLYLVKVMGETVMPKKVVVR
jgi:hypothetical protein